MNTRDRKAFVRTIIEEGVFNTERGMELMVDRIVEKWDEDVDTSAGEVANDVTRIAQVRR